jgi:hypothetical protein
MLYRSDFDELVAKSEPKDLPLIISCTTCPDSTCRAEYVGNGVLVISCATCKDVITHVKLSEEA